MMNSTLWRAVAALLGILSLAAFVPRASASAPVRTAVIEQRAQAGDVTFLYTGAAVQTPVSLTAECAFVVENPHVGAGYTTANCRIKDRNSDQSWPLATVTAGWLSAEAASAWVATPDGVEQIPAGDGSEPVLDLAGDYELCIEGETGWYMSREPGPEVCSPIE